MVDPNAAPSGTKKFVGKFTQRFRPKAAKGDRPEAPTTTGSSEITNPGPQEELEAEDRAPRNSYHGEANKEATPNANADTKPPVDTAVIRDHEIAAMLWDAAYEGLIGEHPRLLQSYERFLAEYLTGDDGGALSKRRPSAIQLPENEIKLVDHSARREQMNHALDLWLSSVDGWKSAYVNNERAVGKALSLREIVGTAMESTRYAALPWAVSCLAAERLLHPALGSEVALSGMIYVISRMNWYISLPRLLLLFNLGNLEELWGNPDYYSLKLGIIDLYKAILLYQIKESMPQMGLYLLREQLIDIDQLEMDRQLILKREEAVTARFMGHPIETRLRQIFEMDEVKKEVDAGDDNEAVTEEQSVANSDMLNEKGLETLLANLHSNSADSGIHMLETNNGNFLELLHQWAVSTDEYQRFLNWDGENSCRVLWVNGAPGTGKTMFLRAVVSRLASEAKESPTSKKLAYFFCDGRKSSQGGATSVVKNFIWQVLREQPSLASHLSKQVVLTGREYFDDPNDFYAMSTVLYSMLDDKNFTTTYFIVDDIEKLCVDVDGGPFGVGRHPSEDERGLDDLFSFIATTSRAPGYADKIKWLVSLDYGKIDAKRTLMDAETHLQLELSSQLQGLREVTNQYVASKVEEIAQQTHYRGGLQAEITQRLQKMSSGNFLWVGMACEVIESSNTPWNAIRALEGSKKDMDSLYRQMKGSINNFEQKDPEYCNDILSTAAIAFRPLRIEELVDIVDLPPEVDPDVIIAKMCSPFLEVSDSSVYFRHHTARDFLTRDLKQSRQLSRENSSMIKRCLETVLKTSESVNDDGSTSVSYATISWLEHLSGWELSDSNLDGESEAQAMSDAMASVNQFLNNDSSLARWLDIVTKQGLLSPALAKMKKLEASLTQKLQRPDFNGNSSGHQTELKVIQIRPLIQKIQELIWFLNFHQLSESPADLNPKNSLLFCPINNTLREMLLPKEFPWLSTVLVLSEPSKDSINTSLQVSYSHRDWVRSCAYSPDGRLVASACDDYNVYVRDAKTGLEQHTFDGDFDSYVFRVVFSGASAGLVAASSREKLVIWDVQTGLQHELMPRTFDQKESEEAKELEESLSVLDIALSTAGDKLAAATGNVVKVWDIPSYKMITMAADDEDEEADCMVNCVRFSPDSRGLLAWTIWNNIILWNVPGGDMHCRLRGHEAGIDGLAFSPDSTLLASASDDYTVRIWNVSSGEQLRVLSEHSSYVNSVAFSPDSTRLASASHDMTIRIWELNSPLQKDSNEDSQKRAQVLRGHLDAVLSVSFSPQGRHVLSSSQDSTLRIWDIADTKQGIDTPFHETQTDDSADVSPEKRHKLPISFLTFSWDGTTIASASDDGLICLWDGNTGDHLRSLREGDRAVLSLSFPPNSKLKFLVSTYIGNTVLIWNTDSGDLMQLSGHDDWVRSAVISPNGRLVASASDDKTVRVWDISDYIDGKNMADHERETARLFQSHEDYVYCVAFSPDGRYLASGGDDYNVFIWDLDQGDKDKSEPDKTLRDDKLRQYVRAVVFIPDGELIISSTASRTADIAIWNWQTETCLKILARGGEEEAIEPFMTLQMDAQYPNVLLTEFGAWPLDLDTLLSQQQTRLPRPRPPQWCPYGLSDDCSWITYRKKKVIFLPKSYRPSKGLQCRVRGHWVVIGSDFGQVMLFKFSADKNARPPLLTAISGLL